MTFEQWLKANGNLHVTEQQRALAKRAWNHNRDDNYVQEMETYVNLTEAAYQSKRDKLKKKTTLYQGKFMIVKAENNRLRSINTAITKRNTELKDALVRTEVRKIVTVIGRQPLRLKKDGYAKVPVQC